LQWEKLGNMQFVYLGYLSIAATLITSYLYQKVTVVLGPKKVMSYTYLNPAAIAILLFIISSQVLSLWVVVGILVSTLATIVLLVKS